MSRTQKTILIIFAALFIDQFSKLWIKTHMEIGDSFRITDWFYIYFVENNGMAFGIEILGKLFLTVFRIIAVGFLTYYLYYLIKKKNYIFGYIACVALIYAGALGNIIDSVFYGVMFDHSYGQVATMFPEWGGYAPLFYGKVVDMLYFPLIESSFPEWFPFWGGEDFVFFSPVFNIADSSICIGIFCILLFYRNTLKLELDSSEDKPKKDVQE